jgi:hypothetical protein
MLTCAFDARCTVSMATTYGCPARRLTTPGSASGSCARNLASLVHEVGVGAAVANIFTGIIAEVAVRDSDAWLYRVSYNITLFGRIVFTQVVIS